MNILTDSQGRPLRGPNGFYVENFSAKIDEIKEALTENQGVPVDAEYDEVPDAIKRMDTPAKLPVGSTTVQKTASTTENIASNDNIRIKGSDGNKYTIAEWNALFVAAGFDKDNMDVSPVGLEVNASGHSEVYLFGRFQDAIFGVTGETNPTAGQLSHSIYNNILITGPASGTDFTTGKEWSVTEDGDELVLWEENTGQTWRIPKDTGAANAREAYNIEARTRSLWAQTEWMRHRMAIPTGIEATDPDGTIAAVDVLALSGSQAQVGEDMYFWIGATNTNILAKYNLNNRHTINSANLTQTIADAIYAKQKANGINMNDTGVNSADKPILAPGSVGAEAIAVNGRWYIITPFISNQKASTATITNNIPDSPAVYWAIDKGVSLPSDTLLDNMYMNKTLVNAAIDYLRSIEGRTDIPVVPAGHIWSAVRQSATLCWYVYCTGGIRSSGITSFRYFVVGASAS